MSASFGGSSSETKTNQSGTSSGTMTGSGATVGTGIASAQTNPWAATTPHLTDLLARIGTAGGGLGTLTPGQSGALAEMGANAGKSGQWTPDIEALTRDLFNTQSRAGMVGDAYTRLQGDIGGVARGEGVNPMQDPTFKSMIDSVSQDAMNRVGAMFAGAGRDLSAGHTGAASRAVTTATLPVIASQYNTNRDRQLQASQTLFGAGQQTGATAAALDAQANQQRAQGIETAQAALASLNLPAQQRLEIENALKTLPINELGLVATQLFQAAGLGSSTTQQQTQAQMQAQQQAQNQAQKMSGTSSTSGTNWGVGASLI